MSKPYQHHDEEADIGKAVPKAKKPNGWTHGLMRLSKAHWSSFESHREPTSIRRAAKRVNRAIRITKNNSRRATAKFFGLQLSAV